MSSSAGVTLASASACAVVSRVRAAPKFSVAYEISEAGGSLWHRYLEELVDADGNGDVGELPVSPMGKVLKTELRAPYWEGCDRRV
jgi:hypothetical protein